MKNKKLFGGAAILGAGAFVAKILGAVYRVPLTNILGGEGLGLYQMVFPVYCLLLDFSGAGVPSALSKLIAERGEDKKEFSHRILKSSIKLFSLIGLIGSVLIAALGLPVATLQGNSSAVWGYVFLSPSVFLVSVISCYRGFFQGDINMKPTAFSQITEQGIKLLAGLLIVSALSYNIPLAVGGATFAVTLSELAALIFLFVVYKIKTKKEMLNDKENKFLHYDKSFFKSDCKSIVKLAVPVALTGTAIPFSQVVDSFIIINVLGTYLPNATSLFGLYSGAATTLINLPVSLLYGISAVTVPFVAAEKDVKNGKKSVWSALLLTFFSAIVFAAMEFFFAERAVGFLFRSLSSEEQKITSDLVKLSAVNIILLSLIQTQNAALIGKGKAYAPVITMYSAIAIKTLLLVLLSFDKNLNIYAAAISTIACYFVACLLNFIILFSTKGRYAVKKSLYRQCSN